MKKILAIILLISMFGINFVNADYKSNKYESIYKNANGKNVNFRDVQLYSYSSTDNTYAIAHIPDLINPTYPKRHEYQNNFKIFIPIYTTYIRLSFSRWGSSGWFDLLVSLDKKPYKGPNNLFEQGSHALSNNVVTGSNPLGVYDGYGCQDNFSCKVYFNRQESNNYGGPYSDANWLTYLNNGWTIRYARAMEFVASFSRKNFTQSKWLYIATDPRPSPTGTNYLQITDYSIVIKVDADKVDADVKKYNLDTKFASECINIPKQSRNACYFTKAFGNDDNIVEGYNKNTKNSNNESQTTTQTPPINPSIDVLTPNSTKKASTISLEKGLNLVGFKGDTKLSDLNGCNIGRYTKGQYNGKKSIFGVKGQNFIITPNNVETSTFTDEMGVFIFVTSDCSLKYSYLSEKQTELTSCVGLGGAGPNGSLGPNDPNKNKKCCSGLKLINNGYNKDGYMLIGAGTICAKVGDGICDNKYENRFNSDDCR